MVWALTALGFLMALSSSLIVPTYLGFDEPQHIDMVAAIAYGDGWPGPGERHVARGVAVGSEAYYGKYYKTHPLNKAMVRVQPRGQRPSINELGGDRLTAGIPNQIVQHPPLYYAIEAGAMLAFDGKDLPYDRFISLLRVVTSLLVAPLPLLVWAIGRRLGVAATVAVAAAALSLAVPGMTRISGYVNNDGFLVITTTALLLGLARVATGDLSRRTAVVVGLLTGLALLSKGFALPLPLLVVLAYLLGARALAQRWVTASRPLVVALVVGFVTGGLWWMRNLLLYGAIQPSGYGAVGLARVLPKPRPPEKPVDVGQFTHVVSDRLARTFWGGVGVTSKPTVSSAGAALLFAALALLVAIGLWRGIRGRGRRAHLVLLLLPFLLTLVLVLDGAWHDYVRYAVFRGVQGRYLYGALAGLALTVAVAGDWLLGAWRRWLPLLAVVGVLLLQGLHARRLVRTLWLAHNSGSYRDALSGIEVISPWPNAVTETVFAGTLLAVVAVLVLVVLEQVRGRAPAAG